MVFCSEDFRRLLASNDSISHVLSGCLMFHSSESLLSAEAIVSNDNIKPFLRPGSLHENVTTAPITTVEKNSNSEATDWDELCTRALSSCALELPSSDEMNKLEEKVWIDNDINLKTGSSMKSLFLSSDDFFSFSRPGLAVQDYEPHTTESVGTLGYPDIDIEYLLSSKLLTSNDSSHVLGSESAAARGSEYTPTSVVASQTNDRKNPAVSGSEGGTTKKYKTPPNGNKRSKKAASPARVAAQTKQRKAHKKSNGKHYPRRSRRTQKSSERKEYTEPTDCDVLLGRGGRSNHHVGNKAYREHVEGLKPRYKNSSKEDKTVLSQSVVDCVHGYKGRFLCLDKDKKKWYVVPNKVARKKVSQAMREVNTPQAREEKRNRYKKQEQTQSDSDAAFVR